MTVSTALRLGDNVAATGSGIQSNFGTVNVSGGVLTVSGEFLLGNRQGVGLASNQRGTLAISGGTVTSNVDITTYNACSTLTLNGGTLDMKGFAIGTLAQQIGSNGGALSFQSGTLQNVAEINGGATVLNKTTTGTLILAGTNSYTGATTVSDGTLLLNSATAIGGTSGLTVNAGRLNLYTGGGGTPYNVNVGSGGAGAISLAAGTAVGGELGGTLYSTAAATTPASGTISVDVFGSPGVTPDGSTAYTLVSAASGLDSGYTLALGKVYNAYNFTVAAANLANSATAITVTPQAATPQTALFWKGGYAPGNNVWAISDGGVTDSNWATDAAGTATKRVPGPTTDVTLSTTSPTAPASNMVLGASMTVKSLTITDAGTVELKNDGNTLTIAPAISSAGITVNSGAGAVTIAANVGLGANQTWTNAGSNPFTVSGAVSGASDLTTNGAIALAGVNTYTGGTTVSSGTLSAGNIVVSGGSSNLGNATSAVTLGSASTQGTLSYTGNDAAYTRGFTIGGAGGGRLDVTTSGQTLTVGTVDVTGTGDFTVGGAGNTTVSSNLTHTGGLTKTGVGTATVAGTNTYTGATNITAGTLALAAGSTNNIANSPTISVAGSAVLDVTGLTSGAIALASGQTLKGAGSIKGGVTVASGSFVSPGASPGTLAITTGGAATTWAGGGHYTWEVNKVDTANQAQTVYKGLDPGHDWLNVTGALNITADSGNKFNLDLTGLNLSNVPGAVDSWTKTKSYDWTIASASGGITGFAAGAFSINTANFTSNNDIGTGTFSILQNSNDIVLHFAGVSVGTPVPVLVIATTDHARVLKNTNFGVAGNVTNAAGTADFVNATLADNGGQMAASGFNPVGPFTVAYPDGNQAFTASVATGNTTGSRTYSIKADNGTYSASDTKNLDVVEARTLTPAGSVTFAVHVGANGSGSTNVTSSTDDHATVADVTLASGSDSGFTITSNGAAFVGGASNPTGTVTLAKTFGTPGTQTGTVTLSGGNGLTPEMTGGANNLGIGYTVQVFTGQAKWNSAADSAWRTDANWTDTGSPATAGAPGVSGLPGVYDTATFDATAAQKSVNLDGAAPHLSAVTFDSATKYTLARGTGGGTLHLDNGSSPATITLLSGSHTISAPMSIDSDTSITGAGSLVDGGDIANAASTLTIGTSVAAAAITGNGATQVNGGLTATSIVQDTLSIGAGGTVTIRPTTAGFGAGGASDVGQPSQVPEPATWVMLIAGAACLLPLVRRLGRRAT